MYMPKFRDIQIKRFPELYFCNNIVYDIITKERERTGHLFFDFVAEYLIAPAVGGNKMDNKLQINNHQIFASKYFTYLPSEELKRELNLDDFYKLEE